MLERRNTSVPVRARPVSGHCFRVYGGPVSWRCSLSRLSVSGGMLRVGCRERAAFIGGWGLRVGGCR